MKIRELFDQCATKYDQDRPRLVPCFDEFYGTAMRMISLPSDTDSCALDLGAGTGLFAAMVTQAFPSLHIHLTDISEAMLLRAQQRFANNPLVTYAVQEHLQLSAISKYDLTLSALSIHHLEHPDKQDLFRKIYCALRPGGVFINADQALAPTPHGEAEYERQWLMDVTAAGVSRSSLEQARERMREDRNALLSNQLTWLSEAGFDNVDCWYKRFRFVVYGGAKMIEQDAAHRPDMAGAVPGQ